MTNHQHPFYRPYMLMLKEGHKIQDDLMDYNLVMLHTNPAETISSPAGEKTAETIDPKLHIPLHDAPPIIPANEMPF